MNVIPPTYINSVEDFERKLFDLANRVANSVAGTSGSNQEKIDALKQLTATYAVLTKKGAKLEPPGASAGFAFSQDIMKEDEVIHGPARISDSRGTRRRPDA